MKLQDIIDRGREWFFSTPERALDSAYRSAIKIKAIEDDHFKGKIVSSESVNYSDSVIKVFRSDVNNYLNNIKIRLTEFNSSRGLLVLGSRETFERPKIFKHDLEKESSKNYLIIEKLNFIDSVISKYQEESSHKPVDTTAENLSLDIYPEEKEKKNSLVAKDKQISSKNNSKKKNPNIETISDKTGVLPRSFMRTFERIQQEISPRSEANEEEVVRKFRRSRYKTSISIWFLLVLIIVPLLTHQITKNFLVAPLVEQYFTADRQIIFINKDLEEEALMELHRYEENLHFKSLIGFTPSLDKEEIEKKIHHKAQELAEEYRDMSLSSVANVFSDILSVIALISVLVICKKEILIVKSFLDEIIYGLSDSAKAFLIILLTDMFVGFHSPHGWEVILENISKHLGVPENHDFIFLFIATFPVILDTVLKYWIFRYLNRISPSSVATYKNMNE